MIFRTMTRVSTLLSTFKIKIEEAVALVPSMVAEEKLKAVQFWNVVSEKLQEIVNNSAADISALAFELEKENSAKASEGSSLPLLQVDDKDQSLVAAEEGILLGQPENAPHPLALATDHLPPYGNSDGITSVSSTLPLSSSHSLTSLLPASSGTLPQDPSQIVGPPSQHSLQSVVGSPSQAITSADQLSSSLIMGPSAQSMLMHTSLEESVLKSQHSNISNSMKIGGNSPRMDVFPQSAVPAPAPAPTSAPLPDETPLQSDSITNAATPKMPKPKANRRRTPNKQPKVEDGDWKVVTDIIPSRKKGGNVGGPNIRRLPPRNSRWKNFTLSDEKDVTDTVEEDEWNNDLEDDNVLNSNDCDSVGHDTSDEEENSQTNGDDIINIEGSNENSESPKGPGSKVIKKKAANSDRSNAHKSSSGKPYICTECGARFSTRGNLIVHCRRHTGEKPYGCPQCNAKFSTKGNLKRHVKTHTGEKPWQCVQCGGCFTEKKSLKVHMRRHTGEKPYQCKVCGKRFAQTGILQTHMAMHMDQKEHLCEHCGKSFRQKSQLRLHMMRHEGLRKYQCLLCPAKFLTKGDLERHNRVHTGERPFICELCGKTFTRQQSLNEHMNRHYGLKPYQCKYCEKGFAEMSACYKHIKQHERARNGEGNVLNNNEDGNTTDTQAQRSDSDVQECGNGGSVTGNIGSVCNNGENTSLTSISASDSQKFTVLVHTDQTRNVDSEISVVPHDHTDQITVVTDNIADFTAINLLASASSFQQNF